MAASCRRRSTWPCWPKRARRAQHARRWRPLPRASPPFPAPPTSPLLPWAGSRRGLPLGGRRLGRPRAPVPGPERQLAGRAPSKMLPRRLGNASWRLRHRCNLPCALHPPAALHPGLEAECDGPLLCCAAQLPQTAHAGRAVAPRPRCIPSFPGHSLQSTTWTHAAPA